jgi:hypothetical protein
MYIDIEQLGLLNRDPALADILQALVIVAGSQGHPISGDAFHRARYHLYELANRELGSSLVSNLLTSSTVQALRRQAFVRAAIAGENEEQVMASSFLRQKDISFGAIYDEYYGATYQGFVEDDLALIKSLSGKNPKRIAYVGGGALPVPAMILAKHYEIPVVCIERCAVNAEHARSLIKKIKLAGLIQVVSASGEDAEYDECDSVICANWIFDRKQVFDQIGRFESVQHILLRSARADTLSPLINDLVLQSDIQSSMFRCAGASTPRPGTSLHSLMFAR